MASASAHNSHFEQYAAQLWLVRLMCLLGWIEGTLPATSTEAAIAKNYQKPSIALAVITRARQIAKVIDPEVSCARSTSSW